MKILHVYKTYYPESLGGVEQLIHSLSTTLAAQGVQSDVLATTDKKEFYQVEDTVNHVSFYPNTINKFSCPISLKLFKSYRKIAEQYDVLHFHFPWPFADLLHLFKNLNKPSVLTYHSDIVRQKTLNVFYKPLMQQFLKRIDCIAPTSNNLLQTSPVLNDFKNKSTVVPIGMEPPQKPKNAEALCKKWQEKFPSPFFLFVGVLRYYKGLDFLLEAAKTTDIPIVIAGAGPEEQSLHDKAKAYQLDNVHFVGRVSEEDKWALLETCYGVIAPSHVRTEAFCISLLEGLIHQKPLISTELGTGTSFVNTNELTGIVVPPSDPLALRKAMQRLLADKSSYEKFKKNTVSHYTNHFTGEKMAQGYLDIYEKLLKSKS